MGLLESAIGGVLGQVLGGRQGGQGGGMSPIVKALLMLLLAKGASGGFGDIFGRGHRGEPGPEADRSAGDGPAPGRGPGGDIGGYDQYGDRRDEPGSDLPGGGFDDLGGMLDGPGDAPARAGTGPRDVGGDRGDDLGGLDGLVDRFRQGGLGDVIESWIGSGSNRPVGPDQLARALGDDTVGALERRTGMDRDQLLAELARALPEVVHALTPRGRMPDAEERRMW
ncbi:YidB family protein [Methylobacterium sp. NEAU 140]|uniref:YidB family protein n=1 Tax=Methylobacterium sp. NEAU 140 TaxID=3064945 RepID=UPI002734042B|nr:YidB family protein [Methylobacterium sp. NEAU 140]MDP4022475.1 YidB family protein [Methylobacterium sp. NEAU 140]